MASARLRRVHSHPMSEYTPIRDIVHHGSPTSASFPLPGRDFEGVGSGMTAFQMTVSDDSSDGKAEERSVIMNSTPRASRLFHNRKAVSFRLGLRKSRKVRLVPGLHRQHST